MNAPVLTTIAVTGFTIAFLHAAIPTHWLPFALIGRARGWSRRRTLAAASDSAALLAATPKYTDPSAGLQPVPDAVIAAVQAEVAAFDKRAAHG